MNLYKLLLIAPMYAAAVLAPQVGALILLSTSDFGMFSLVYLIYAWGTSLTMSVAAEPWNRRALDGDALEWEHYLGACLWVAVGAGVAASVFVLTVSSWSTLTLAFSGLAVSAAVLRSGSRFFLVHQGLSRRVGSGDLLFIVGFIAGILLSSLIAETAVETIMMAWLIGSVGALLTNLPVSKLPMGLPSTVVDTEQNPGHREG